MAKLEIPSQTFDVNLVAGGVKPAMKAAAATAGELWMVPIEQLIRIPDFNVRIETPDYIEHRESIVASILANGFYKNKPLAGYVAKTEGGESAIFVTDGYTRLAAAEIAKERGAELDKLPVIVKPAADNLEDLTVALVQDNEGRPLSTFEKAIVAKRLLSMGVEDAVVAKRLGMTDRYLSDLIVLAGAPGKIRNLVINGKIAPTEAVKQLRKNPTKAAEVLTTAVAAAEARGKGKATAKDTAAAEAGAGDEGGEGDDDTPRNIISSKKISKAKQVEKLTFKLKGGEKVRKGLLESILTVDGGSWWRDAEDLDDAEEGDVVITKTITISLTVEQAAPEGEADTEETEAGDGDGDDTAAGEGEETDADADSSAGL